jgi:DNA-binding CsgD family transcriptional regulator
MARPRAARRPPWGHAHELIELTCAAPGDDRALRASILGQIRPVVPFDAYVWVLTDPATTVGASPLAEVPSLHDLPSVIRLKYLTSINRWTSLPRDRVMTLAQATGGDLTRSALWRELLHSYGVHDVVSAVLHDSMGCWGFLDLWRIAPQQAAFTPEEQAFLNAVLPTLTRALRTSLAATFTTPTGPGPPEGPAVLLLTDELQPAGRTPHTDDQLRALLPTPPGRFPVPAIALNVAAQLLASEAGVDTHPPFARVHQGDGRWIEVRAARLSPEPATGPTIAVTIERATPSRRVEVYSRVIGLTRRETELLSHLVSGADTRATARALGIAEHTVNDHLRSIFAKAGTNSRRQLIANAHG